MIVGRVDCTKHSKTCQDFSIESYPTIIYIGDGIKTKYRGDRSEESMLHFADRLAGPSLNKINDCKELRDKTHQHGLILLSSIKDSNNQIQKEFESLANTHKSEYWFYQINKTCKGLIFSEGIYLLKRHLNKAIEFVPPKSPDDDIKNAIVSWIRNESFPVFGQLSKHNVEYTLATGKTIVLSILDEYKPAKKFSIISELFHKSMEKLARQLAQQEDKLLFAWTSDAELVEYITLASVKVPSLILLRPDFTYHLIHSDKPVDDKDKELPENLTEGNVKQIIEKARQNKLEFSGGDSFFHSLFRIFFSNYQKFIRMYKANPLLLTLLFGFPSLIVAFVIYTTCFYDNGPNEDDFEDEDQYNDEDASEEKGLLAGGHQKQD